MNIDCALSRLPWPESCRGVLLGLALGDTLGAPHEGGWLERAVWWALGCAAGGVRRWSDDTRMAMDLAESLLACDGLDQEDLAQRFAASYRWHRGYGPGAAKVLRRIRAGQPWQQANRSVYRQGSWGNGAAMRAPVLALWPFPSMGALAVAARQSALITHAHPEGIEGAVLIAVATRALMQGQSQTEVLMQVRQQLQVEAFDAALALAADWLAQAAEPTPGEVAASLGNGITARTSCVTALYIALRHLQQPFAAMAEYAIACGGDTDTIAAMAGALWGAFHGAAALPALPLEQREHLQRLALALASRLDA